METGQFKFTSKRASIGRSVPKTVSLPATELIAQNRSARREHHELYPAASDNSTVDIFGAIDENERSGRTFSLIADFIDSLTPRCVKPCTMDAYIRNTCCETVVLVPPPQPNVCCQQQPMPPYFPPYVPPYPLPGSTTSPERPVVIVPAPTRPVMVLPTYPLAYPLSPSQCCTTCTMNGYYGPPPCVRYPLPGTGQGSTTQYLPPFG